MMAAAASLPPLAALFSILTVALSAPAPPPRAARAPPRPQIEIDYYQDKQFAGRRDGDSDGGAGFVAASAAPADGATGAADGDATDVAADGATVAPNDGATDVVAEGATDVLAEGATDAPADAPADAADGGKAEDAANGVGAADPVDKGSGEAVFNNQGKGDGLGAAAGEGGDEGGGGGAGAATRVWGLWTRCTYNEDGNQMLSDEATTDDTNGKPNNGSEAPSTEPSEKPPIAGEETPAPSPGAGGQLTADPGGTQTGPEGEPVTNSDQKPTDDEGPITDENGWIVNTAVKDEPTDYPLTVDTITGYPYQKPPRRYDVAGHYVDDA